MESINGTTEIQTNDHFNPSVRILHIPKLMNGSCGFHLSRSKFDPYPWISYIDKESPAETSGLKSGDCVLEVNGEDILGMRITEVAQIVRAKTDYVSLLLWNSGIDSTCNSETLCCGPMPLNLERLSACVSTILSALECPICLDTIPPPVIQCQNGHLVCANCRCRSDKCPVCRERYVIRRSLIAEQVLSAISSSFNLCETDGKIRERLFGVKYKKKLVSIENDIGKPTKSHAHTFLAKIMGKSSSVDNLSTNKKEVHLGDNNMLKTKSLSLSTSEIFRPDTTISIQRCPSASNGLSSSQTNLATKRPTSSCNVSTEDLQENNEENVIQIPVPLRIIEQLYYCPCEENCDVKLNGSKIDKHINEVHKVPILYFGTSSAKISLPTKIPVDNACFVLILDGFQFWFKIILNSDGVYQIPALIKSTEIESSNFIIETLIHNNPDKNKLLSKELIIRSPIYAMENNSLKEILNNLNVISYLKESLQFTFQSDIELVLTVNIKRVIDL